MKHIITTIIAINLKRVVKLIVSLALLLIFGCVPTQKHTTSSLNTDQSKDPSPELDWILFNYPRTSDPPGYVFRIKKGESKVQPVISLGTSALFKKDTIILPSRYNRKKFKASAFLRFFKLTQTDPIISEKDEATIETSIEIGKALQESIFQSSVDSLIINSDINWNDNYKYYIIQATLSTKRIRFKSSIVSGFDVESLLNYKIGEVGANLSKDKVDSTYLNEVFNNYYRVYYTLLEINSTGIASSNRKVFTYKRINLPLID